MERFNRTLAMQVLVLMMVGAFFTIAASGKKNKIQKTTPATHSIHFHNIDIKNMSFDSGKLTIVAGDTVQWANKDNVPHMVNSDTGDELKSPLLNPGQIYRHIFPKAGKFTYLCPIHPMMIGTVTVK
jgi:plastocyanin